MHLHGLLLDCCLKNFMTFWWKSRRLVIRVHEKSINRFKNKVKEITSRSNAWDMEYRIKRLRQITIRWLNYFGIADISRITKELDEWIRRRHIIIADVRGTLHRRCFLLRYTVFESDVWILWIHPPHLRRSLKLGHRITRHIPYVSHPLMHTLSIPLLFPAISIVLLFAIGKIFYGDFGMIYSIIRDNAILYPTTIFSI